MDEEVVKEEGFNKGHVGIIALVAIALFSVSVLKNGMPSLNRLRESTVRATPIGATTLSSVKKDSFCGSHG